MSVRRNLIQDTVSVLDSYLPIIVPQKACVADAVKKLQESGRGCVVVCDGETLKGIFTERDVLIKVFGENQKTDLPITQLMTPNPVTVRLQDSTAWVIKKMRKGGYRHIPVVDDQGRPIRIVSIKHIVQYLVEHFPETIYNLPPDPDQIMASREGA